MNKKIRRSYFSGMPLWAQLTVLITLVCAVIISVVMIVSYQMNKSTMLRNEAYNSHSILTLEMSNMEQYISGLTSFALQPCYDTRFTRDMESGADLADRELDYIKEAMKGYYYSRSDLGSYWISFLNQDVQVGRDLRDQHMSVRRSPLEPEDEDALQSCIDSRYNQFICPGSNSEMLMTFYHTISKVGNDAPYAMVKAVVDKRYIRQITGSVARPGEYLVLLSGQNELLYSDIPASLTPDSGDGTDLLLAVSENASEGRPSLVRLGDQNYLFTRVQSKDYGLSMISLRPYSTIGTSLTALFYHCLLWAVVLWLIAFVLVRIVVHFTSRPLTTLAQELEKMGGGNFGATIDISGSSEIDMLRDSYNDMSRHIDSLIRQNYLSRLNEQAARLTALEAQLNPHFLYNTLQAISTEALVNDQMKINDMVTSLAAILRYSIKGGDFVTVREEMKHVNYYFSLQKERLDSNLTYEVLTDPSADQVLIPKLCIQTLVENAIIHGIGESVTGVHVTVELTRTGQRIRLVVSDNGIGMTPEQLEKLRTEMAETDLPGRNVGIGLVNLYSRLQIHYNRDAVLSIDSVHGDHTTVTIDMPILDR